MLFGRIEKRGVMFHYESYVEALDETMKLKNILHNYLALTYMPDRYLLI
jgi:hypothetical protein